MSQNVDGRNMDVITHLATVTLVYLMTNIGWARLLARGQVCGCFISPPFPIILNGKLLQLWNDLPMS